MRNYRVLSADNSKKIRYAQKGTKLTEQIETELNENLIMRTIRLHSKMHKLNCCDVHSKGVILSFRQLVGVKTIFSNVWLID